MDDLYQRFKAKDRGALAKVITLLESMAPHDQNNKLAMLSKIKGNNQSMRIAISGPPGVGKSTFINILGHKLLALGHKLAILAIDPSSVITKGSILGDKLRMQSLLNNRDQVYIRPSPSLGMLGGVSLATKDVILAVEDFGFDVVIIETVGVGQNEMMASLLSDHFIVLLDPNSGDYVQALKRGVLELAHAILINKADDALAKASMLAKAFTYPNTYIAIISAHSGLGIDDVISFLNKRHEDLIESNEIHQHRQDQLKKLAPILLMHALNEELQHQGLVNMTNLKDDTSFTPLISARIKDWLDHIINDK